VGFPGGPEEDKPGKRKRTKKSIPTWRTGGMKMIRFALLLTMGLMVPSIARANVTFSYVTDSTSYSPNTSTVNVYLQEFVPTGNVSLSQSVTGTYAIGFYAQTSGGATISNYSSNAAFTTNPTTDYALGGTQYDYTASQPSGTTSGQKLGTQTSVSGGTTYKLLVGTFTLANTVNGSTITLSSLSSAPPEGPGSDSTFTLPSTGAYNLDAGGTQTGSAGTFTFTGVNNAAPFVATFAAVPEPSSMILCGLAACGMGYGAWRRRKAAQGQDEVPQPPLGIA
jgi:hypothetical protein